MDLFKHKLYQNAAKRVQFRIDAASKLQQEVFGQTWYSKHFKMGLVPHTVKQFDTILGKMHSDIAASTINSKSAEPLRAFEGYGRVPQEMFTFAHAYRLEADDIRDMMMMVNNANNIGEAQVADFITNKLFDIVKNAVQGVRSRLDIIILDALSNGGVFTFTADNDPSSPYIGKSIDFGMPGHNKWEVGTGNEWVAAHKSTVDPLVDIDNVCQGQSVKIKKMLTDRETMRFILSTDAMKGYINTTVRPNLPLSMNAVNAFLSENGYPTFEIVERECLVQKGDKLLPYTPFKKGQIVFLPEEQIGTIETCITDSELGLKSDGVKYSNYGRIEVRKYTLGEKENSDYTEITKASMTAAPSMDTINYINVLDTTK